MGGLLSCAALNLCECAACMACSCCSSLVSATLAQAARFGHMLIILVTFILAIIIGKSYPNEVNGYNYYTQIDITGDCNSEYQNDCMYRQLIYRASFSLVILFSFLTLTSAFSDYVNRSFWVIKFGFAIGLFIAFWWVENSFFSGWAEAARYISFGWLLVQGLLLLDFSHDVHDILMPVADESDEGRPPYGVYLGISFCGFFCAVIGLVYLFLNYTGCDMGMFFTILTLIVGVLTTVTSLLDSVGRGLLTPGLMFAYSVFMCWYALLSNPHESCNPTANSSNGQQNGAIVVVAIISAVIVLYCVANGTKILNIFNPAGEGVMQSYAEGGGAHQSEQNKELNAVLTGEEEGQTVTAQPTSAAAARTSSAADADKPLLPYQLSASHATTHHSSVYRAAAAEAPKSSGTPSERAFYHLLMVLVSCYGCMILTNWGKTDGSPVGSPGGGGSSTGNQSMWLKIVSQWVFLVLYAKVLHVSYMNNQE